VACMFTKSHLDGWRGYWDLSTSGNCCIRDYLDLAKHGDDLEGPLFRPVKDNRKAQESRRYLAPIAIDRVLRKYARSIGLDRGYSAHSMRATFITTALDKPTVSLGVTCAVVYTYE